MTIALRKPYRLSTIQRALLSTANQRKDQLVVPPETMTERAFAIAVRPLLTRGLVTETRLKRGQPHWRRNKTDQRIGLRLTPAALSLLGTAPGTPAQAVDRATRRHGRESSAAVAPGLAPSRAVRRPRGNDGAGLTTLPRPRTKAALLTTLLARKNGASLAELATATGWLPHTTRAALTRLRQTGCNLRRSKNPEGVTTYHLTAGVAETRSGETA